MIHKFSNYLSLIKFSHTIFAMPFALVGFSLAVLHEHRVFQWQKLLLVIGCMVFARSAAMAFNRYIDRQFDGQNERTASREIPSGKISPTAALSFIILSSLAFMTCTYFLNLTCFFLSPVALIVILGYSLTKRFTALCHFVLGLGLSLAPIGAYLAVTGSFAILPVIFSFVVLFWTGGFDILYALQDENFDKTQSLFSVPSRFGRVHAMAISNTVHIMTGLLVILAGYFGSFNVIYWIGAACFLFMLYYQHSLVKPNDISKVNLAFATTNGLASVVFGAITIASFVFE